MKKALKYIGIFLLINVGILGLILGISYIIVKINKTPIMKHQREEYKIKNGYRTDGLIYSYTNCKNKTGHITFVWKDYKCPVDRVFEDGFYTNERGVKIAQDVFENIIKKMDAEWQYDEDLDTYLDQGTYNWLVDLYEHDGKEYKYCKTEEKDPWGNNLYTRTDEKIALETKEEKYSCNRDLKYCFIGLNKNKEWIRAEYKDEKCDTPENICELLKEDGAHIQHPESYYQYCLDKMDSNQ